MQSPRHLCIVILLLLLQAFGGFILGTSEAFPPNRYTQEQYLQVRRGEPHSNEDQEIQVAALDAASLSHLIKIPLTHTYPAAGTLAGLPEPLRDGRGGQGLCQANLSCHSDPAGVQRSALRQALHQDDEERVRAVPAGVCSLLAPEARAPGESLLVTTSPFFSSSKVSFS